MPFAKSAKRTPASLRALVAALGYADRQMSLIYAKKISESELFFIADTKFTYSEPKTNIDRRRSGADEFFGGLKLVVLHGGLIVAFAGEVEFAKYAIEGIYEKSINLWDARAVSQYFSAYAIQSKNQTDFLVGFYLENEVVLIKIVGDQISEESTAWLGDFDGFSDFQKNLISDAPIELEVGHSQFQIVANTFENETSISVFKEVTKHQRALSNVISSSACESVSGVVTAVCTSRIGFRYTEYLSTSGPPTPATNGSGGVHFGSEATGSFCISSGREVNCPVYPAIYHVGKFALIYSPTSSFQPSMIKMDEIADVNARFEAEVRNVAKKIDLLFDRVART